MTDKKDKYSKFQILLINYYFHLYHFLDKQGFFCYKTSHKR